MELDQLENNAYKKINTQIQIIRKRTQNAMKSYVFDDEYHDGFGSSYYPRYGESHDLTTNLGSTRYYARKIGYFNSTEIFDEIENKRNIILYNNYVADLSGFMNRHPGSRELITRNLGCNISLVLEGYSSTA